MRFGAGIQACGLGRDCPVCGRAIFVTGGTGSFGRAFAETLLTAHEPARVTLYSRDEHRQAEAARALSDLPAGKRLRMRLGDVRDYDRLRWAIEGHEVVVHAAALKSVGQGLSNPEEVVKTNVGGTMNCLRAATDAGVQRVLTLSSDKCANPRTFYGQSKAMAEALTVAWNTMSFPRATWCSATRWGNVLGSSGSVVHVFRRQIAEGRPLTLSDERMTRFWLSLAEAVGFALKALAAMRAGEVFIPPLPAMRIRDLAECIAPWPAVEYVGALPTEKIHEDLVTEDEAARAVTVNGMIVIEPPRLDWPRAPWIGEPVKPLRSDTARVLTHDEMLTMLAGVT